VEDLKTKADKAFRDFAHWQFATNLFNNPYIDRVTPKALYDLIQDPNYKKLITDLLILMYTQQGFIFDVRKLTEVIIDDYLVSNQSKKDLASIVIDLTLRDHKYVLPGTEKLIVDFFGGPDKPYLTKLCGKIFIDIGRSTYIEESIHQAMVWQMRQYLN